LAGRENANQFGARTKIGDWRYGTGGALDEDMQAQGKARAGEDMGRAGGWSNLLNTGLDLFGYGGGGIQKLLGPMAKDAMNFSF